MWTTARTLYFDAPIWQGLVLAAIATTVVGLFGAIFMPGQSSLSPAAPPIPTGPGYYTSPYPAAPPPSPSPAALPTSAPAAAVNVPAAPRVSPRAIDIAPPEPTARALAPMKRPELDGLGLPSANMETGLRPKARKELEGVMLDLSPPRDSPQAIDIAPPQPSARDLAPMERPELERLSLPSAETETGLRPKAHRELDGVILDLSSTSRSLKPRDHPELQQLQDPY